MQLSSWIKFVLQSVIAGLALAFVLMVVRPAWLPAGRGGPAPAPGGMAQGYAQAVAAAAPSVVNIYTTRYVARDQNPMLGDPFLRDSFGEYRPNPNMRRETSLGSGVVVDRAGFVLTNHHVVAGADAIEIALQDGRTGSGRVIGTDPDTDLAVLQTNLRDLPVMASSDSDQLRVGDIVLAIGNPFGVGQTVTQGIVSATGRDRVGINIFENFIQTDAAINPGNSGGALVNVRGEIVGINTAILSGSGGSQGVGFAIPMNMAREIKESIVRNGRVVRGWLGVELYDLTPAGRQALSAPVSGGAMVKGVVMNGPADDAGLMAYDVITEIGGVAVRDATHSLALITQLPPDKPVEVRVLRQGRSVILHPMVMQRPRQSFTTG